MTVRFKEKDATVRYLPGKVGLTQILKRYDDTPFDVTADKPIVSVVRTKTATLRGWTVRKKTPKASGVKKLDPISVHVEIVPTKGTRISSAVNISMSNPPAARLKSRDAFRSTKVTGKPTAVQFMATIIESSRLKPGDSIIPVGYQLSTLSTGEKPEKLAGTFHVILRTLPSAPADNAVAGTGVALIGGILDLRLGHLCDQRGCVSHLHKSLAAIPGVAGMSPHPDLKGRNSATGALR